MSATPDESAAPDRGTGLLWCATHGRMVPPSFRHKCHADDPEPCDIRMLVVGGRFGSNAAEES